MSLSIAKTLFSNQFRCQVMQMQKVGAFMWRVKKKDSTGKHEAVYKWYVGLGEFIEKI